MAFVVEDTHQGNCIGTHLLEQLAEIAMRKDIRIFKAEVLTGNEEMVRSVKANRLLEGWRGSRPADTEVVDELLLRISAMVEDLPQIQNIDLNPVKVLERGNGCVVVDARVILAGSPVS